MRLTHDFLNFPGFLKVFIFTVFLWGIFHFFEEVLRNFSFRAGQTKKILLLYLNKSKKKSKFKPVSLLKVPQENVSITFSLLENVSKKFLKEKFRI